MTLKQMIIAGCIVLCAFGLRALGNNWDGGFHQHPDERMLIMVTHNIQLFDQIDPNFFNYGSLPIYVLKIVATSLERPLQKSLDTYDGLLVVGRWISTIVDTTTVVLVMLLAWSLTRSVQITQIAGIAYGLSFFAIQNSNFFVVDVFLTFLVTLLLWMCVIYIQSPSYFKVIILGLVWGLCIATKITGLVFGPLLITLIVWRQAVMPTYSVSVRILQIIVYLMALLITTGMASFLAMPYAYIRFDDFWKDIQLQLSMNTNPYIFPYTLQYVSTTPYWYYLRNIFIWGVGPVATITFLYGVITSSIALYLSNKKKWQTIFYHITPHKVGIIAVLFVVLWYSWYFAISGRSAVKFMRYMLPLYPAIAIGSAVGVSAMANSLKNPLLTKLCVGLMLGGWALWTMGFMHIYLFPHTRLEASQWIHTNIPAGSVLAVEHWDDRLPLMNSDIYIFEELALYELPDSQLKWDHIKAQLSRADYIVIASNKLYTPLQKLTDCHNHPQCYPMTAAYYQDLFAHRLGFTQIAEFARYPSWFGVSLNDQGADESFTVYDHPRVLIFTKTTSL